MAGGWARLQFTFYSIITIATVGVIYSEAALPLIKLGGSGGSSSGFLSSRIDQIETLVPLILAMLMLGIAIWFLVSGVQEERTVNRRR